MWHKPTTRKRLTEKRSALSRLLPH